MEGVDFVASTDFGESLLPQSLTQCDYSRIHLGVY